MAIYFTTTILVVVIIVTIVWDENLTIYSAAYAYGSAVSTTAILVIVFFTKVYTVCIYVSTRLGLVGKSACNSNSYSRVYRCIKLQVRLWFVTQHQLVNTELYVFCVPC